MARTLRFDMVGQLRQPRETPQGGLIVPAYIARVGVQTYERPDGSKFREYRPAEEVFSPEALASFEHAPVTMGHPSEVRADTWRNVAIGHQAGEVKPDGDFVATDLVVQESQAVQAIKDKTAREVSCGYTCDLECTPGIYDGEHYDGIQRNIRGNHIAIGPKGWGRAGSDVSLRIDGTYTTDMADTNIPAPVTAPQPAPAAKDGPSLKLELLRRIDAAEGENAALRAQVEKLTKDLAEATDPKRLDAMVDARLTFRGTAKTILGTDYSFEGKTERQVMLDAITKTDSTFRADGRSDDYVAGAFNALSLKPNAGLAALNAATRADAAPADDPIEAARKRNEDRNRSAFADARKGK